ncbi:hypothetical protein H0H87_002378 [Tephrocybe sp. NHM501043]|nr:hypothetical protein H0H87_002378 [Tephrocybe sp. NHM501043]
MLEKFLPRWFQRYAEGQDTRRTPIAETGLPFPVGTEKQPRSKHKWKGGDLKLVPGAAISHPIPRSSPQSLSLTGIETSETLIRPWQYHYQHPHPSPTRSGPSNVEWKVGSSSDSEQELELDEAHDVKSMPTLEVLNTNPTFTQGTTYLKLDTHATVDTDVYAHAYSYPLAKQLSPIAEQDYFSPVSLRTPISLPNGESNSSIAYTMAHGTNPSPGSSQKSEITRPSPSYSIPHPFIARQVNRTISQSSSQTQASTTSSIPRATTFTPVTGGAKNTPTEPPLLPPLSLAPPFPGPHPSYESVQPTPRPRRLPVIEGSSESAVYDVASEVYGGEDDSESLHPDSFVTASPKEDVHDRDVDMDIAGTSFEASVESAGIASQHSQGPSVRSDASILPPSGSESFIGRRWERDAAFGTGIFTLSTKRQWLADCTPAFWTFWLGFLFPVLWFVGGWHFTRFGEQPSRVTFWEFYFNTGVWKRAFGCVFCCVSRRKEPKNRPTEELQRPGDSGHVPDVEHKAGVGGRLGPRLPRWVAEKQSSDDGRLRLQDPKRSLRGISFGYPFIPRPVSMRRSTMSVQPVCWRRRVMDILEKPHRLFDCFYGVKLREDVPLTIESYLAKRIPLQNSLWPSIPLLPGARKLVLHLKAHNIPIAVATGSKRVNFERKTGHLSEVFDCFEGKVVCADDHQYQMRGKPNPDIFLTAAREVLGRDVGQVDGYSTSQEDQRARGLVFEDSISGMQAGKRAGMSVIWVPDSELLGVQYSGKEMADQKITSIENFIPEEWGLPPYDS